MDVAGLTEIQGKQAGSGDPTEELIKGDRGGWTVTVCGCSSLGLLINTCLNINVGLVVGLTFFAGDYDSVYTALVWVTGSVVNFVKLLKISGF